MAWSAFRLKEKRSELIEVLERYDIDILLVSETFLKPGHKFALPGYSVCRVDRLRTKGGDTLNAMRSHLRHVYPEPPEMTSLEAAVAVVEVRAVGPIRVFSTYAPPSRPFSADNYQSIFSYDEPTLVIGDLNAKHPFWGCRVSNGFGKHLLQFLNGCDVRVHAPEETTYFSANFRPDILDIALSRGLTSVRISAPTSLTSLCRGVCSAGTWSKASTSSRLTTTPYW
ncbi:Endonuclease-reverse transcriptase [Popillia japonica]|uniref:Endonuclease-reverse transcriptase n=1 Tax=Popillia japonica TaxID=7064 RepID=A0AAW1KBK3_POPJA